MTIEQVRGLIDHRIEIAETNIALVMMKENWELHDVDVIRDLDCYHMEIVVLQHLKKQIGEA